MAKLDRGQQLITTSRLILTRCSLVKIARLSSRLIAVLRTAVEVFLANVENAST
jgi:hypothetical protein